MIVNKENEIIKEAYNIIKKTIPSNITVKVEDMKENQVIFKFCIKNTNVATIINEDVIDKCLIEYIKEKDCNCVGEFLAKNITEYLFKIIKNEVMIIQ